MRPLAGDFNADDREDIAVFYETGGCVTALLVFFSTGTGFAPPAQLWSSRWCQANAYYFAGDFNGDGRTDVAHLTPGVNQEWRVFGLYSAGETFSAPAEWYRHPQWSADPARIVVNAADYNADGGTGTAPPPASPRSHPSTSTARTWPRSSPRSDRLELPLYPR